MCRIMSISRVTTCVRILMLIVAQTTLAQYHPSNPHMQENFDIANARDLGFITCLGDRSDLPLPDILPSHNGGFFNPQTKTMQQLCAKPQYGGGNQFEHVGGFCGESIYSGFQYLTGSVFYDVSIGARINTYLATPRMLAECSFRCYCSNVTEGQVPFYTIQRNNIQLQPMYIAADDIMAHDRPRDRLDSTFQPYIEVPDNYDVQYPLLDQYLHPTESTEWVDATVHEFECEVKADWIDEFGDDNVPDLVSTESYTDVNGRTTQASISLDPRNGIECEGPLPIWDLPAPYVRDDFTTHVMDADSYRGLNSFCAVYQSGGFLSANAGGYCHTGADGQREVWFSDAMTPRITWTWNGLPAAAAIRYHCWANCRCRDRKNDIAEFEQQTDGSPQIWNIILEDSVHMGVYKTPQGDIRLQAVVNSTGTAITTDVQLVPANSTANGTHTCEPVDSWLCQNSWPSSIAAKPTAPPGIPNESYNVTTQSIGTCGLSKTCTGQASCGNSTQSCKCTEPDTETARKYGLDPVFPSPICLAITALNVMTTVASGIYKKPPGIGGQPGNGKRGLSLDFPQVTLNGDGEAWRCLCNSTYTSTACCLVDDGVVWEAPVFR